MRAQQALGSFLRRQGGHDVRAGMMAFESAKRRDERQWIADQRPCGRQRRTRGPAIALGREADTGTAQQSDRWRNATGRRAGSFVHAG
jgi:hypothetical protein